MSKPIKKLILGDDAANTLVGFDDSEGIFGQGGNDTISAWRGGDSGSGGNGNDVVNGGPGNDDLAGDAGNDTLVGEAGNDRLDGSTGDDILIGNQGNDDLIGGLGADKFLIGREDGVDRILDFSAEDKIDFGAFNFASSQQVLDSFQQKGANAVIDLGDGDKLVLQNTLVADLSASQFNVSPYLVPSVANSGVSFVPLMTVGEHVGDYTMPGITDGLGAFDNGDGTFTVLMNHELTPTDGAVRDHGSTGAFVSALTIDKTTLEVIEGHDLIQTVHQFDPATDSYFTATTAFNRFCSADLAQATAFDNAETGLGYNGGSCSSTGGSRPRRPLPLTPRAVSEGEKVKSCPGWQHPPFKMRGKPRSR